MNACFYDLRERGAPEPVVRLEEGETVRFDERLAVELPVPRDVGEELKTACETLGTVVPEINRIGTDPTAFLREIAGFVRVGWESDRHVIWYWRDERLDPRAYQIERSELVFRAQEWVDEASSKEALTDHYDLNQSF